jgi:choline kinase
MKVAMLAAGVGDRLGMGEGALPKALLRFGGKTLLERHLDNLAHFGLDDVTLVVGHLAGAIEQELEAIGARDRVRTCLNPDYPESSLLSLWQLRHVLAAGEPVLYMDADVLYDWRLLARLIGSRHDNCLLIDRDVDPDEELLEVCIRAGRVVDFHKRVQVTDYDQLAEWIGFARFDGPTAAELATSIGRYVASGRTGVIYEEPMRDVILSAAANPFGVEDVGGLPWIEIDFPEDLERARREIHPRLAGLPTS